MEYPIVNVGGECFDYIRVYSDGIWNLESDESIFQHSFMRFQVQIIIMFFISHAFHHCLFKHLYIPRLASDFMAGIVLGRTGLEYFYPEKAQALFPPVPNQVFASILKIGYVLFTFLTAVRLDTNWIKRIGRRGLILGSLMFIFPFTITRTLDVKLDPKKNLTVPEIGGKINNSRLFISAFARSQYVDVSVVLMQLRITNSRLGHLALATALLGDVALFGFGSFTYIIDRVALTHSVRTGVQSFCLLILFFGFTVIIMRMFSFWFIRITPEGQPIKDLYIHVFVAIVLVFSSIGDTMGLHYLWGPFLLGMIIPAGSPLATTLTSKLDTIVHGLLIPLMTTFCASKLNIWALIPEMDSAYNFQMAVISYVIKMVATFIFVLCIRLPFKEAMALTLILNVKGITEIGLFLSYSRIEMGDLDSASGVLLVFLLTSFSPPLIRMLYDPSRHYIGYKRKSIEHTPVDAELEILACAHKQEDAMAAIKLFEISKPTKQSPISVYGLCLEELVSSITPLLIDHQFGQKSSSSQGSKFLSRTHSIIDIFKYFKLEFSKSAQVSVFTAVSPLKQMHEDICWLAFDKSCSLIVLPFHKKWNSNGNVVSNNTDFRNLNISVLDRAPCSVGILIDRRRKRGFSSLFDSSTVFRVATLFAGGPDDREALAYGLRMARSPENQLTVVLCVAAEEIIRDSWENMLDLEALRILRQETAVNTSITCIQERVRDGSDTAAVVKSIQGQFDLIMVGRRHENNPEVISGLSHWAEYSELGAIGDLFASADIVSSGSILVMQQQIMKADHSCVLNS